MDYQGIIVSVSVVAGCGLIISIFLSFFAKRYRMGSMAMPMMVPTILHPKGDMPKMETPMEIRILPRGGCVFS